LLMAADRAQHVAEVIRPALERGDDVVTDRFTGSSLAYQGFGRGLDRRFLADLSHWATGGIEADVVFLLDVPLDIAAQRRRRRPDERYHRSRVRRRRRPGPGGRAVEGVVGVARPRVPLRRPAWQRETSRGEGLRHGVALSRRRLWRMPLLSVGARGTPSRS